MFFDKNGNFRLDEVVAEHPTFKQIMEDGLVTDDEIIKQSELVIALYKKLEETFTEPQLMLIADTIVQTDVLQAVIKYRELTD